MNYRLMITTIGALCLLAAVAGCSSSQRAASESDGNEQEAALTAHQARRAIIELIRARPDTFIGSPDPDKLANLPLEDRGQGEYAFGVFIINLSKRWYAADIGHNAPELYSYNGSFVRRDGKWIASEPDVKRFRRALE